MSEFDDFVAKKRAEIDQRRTDQRQREEAATKEAQRVAALIGEFERIDYEVSNATVRLNQKLHGIGKLTLGEGQAVDGAIAHVLVRYRSDEAKGQESALLRLDLRKDSTVAAFIAAGGPRKSAFETASLADASAAWIERTLEKFVQAVA